MASDPEPAYRAFSPCSTPRASHCGLFHPQTTETPGIFELQGPDNRNRPCRSRPALNEKGAPIWAPFLNITSCLLSRSCLYPANLAISNPICPNGSTSSATPPSTQALGMP